MLGSYLTIDECIIRYMGRSNETIYAKNKPTPLGFKNQVIAQAGFFIHQLQHLKDAKYEAVGIKQEETRSAEQNIVKEAAKENKIILLNNIQSVVIALCNNLFSLLDLFRSLRAYGHNAIGIARINCGIYKDLKRDKQLDKRGKSGYAFNQVKGILIADNQVITLRQTYLYFPYYYILFLGQPNRVERQQSYALLNNYI